MTTIGDSFFAFTDAETAHDQIAFQNWPGSVEPGSDLIYKFGAVGYGWAGGIVGCASTNMTRILGNYSTFAGVHGTASNFTGVAGTSLNHVGVYGQVEDNVPLPNFLHAGVLGAAMTQPGVMGISTKHNGVQGVTVNGFGVFGESAGGLGVKGLSRFVSGVVGVSGSDGPLPDMGVPPAAGVLGAASYRPGVIGTSNDFMGVYGFSTGSAGVVGETANPGSFAGYFTGNVAVTGQIFAGTKNAIVAFPDGSKRVLHCMESPEHWFEDFGTAKLKRGRVLVTLDADFAKVIKRGDYRVFVTPEGDCRGLYIRHKRAASFEVRELAGGKSSAAFSYRIVGRRNDIMRHRRFAKIDTRLPGPVAVARAARKRPSQRAFIAELEQQARAKATPAMRKSDREVAAMPVPDLTPPRVRTAARSRG